MKYKIEKNTVQETLVIPLYARRMCSALFPDLYWDGTQSEYYTVRFLTNSKGM